MNTRIPLLVTAVLVVSACESPTGLPDRAVPFAPEVTPRTSTTDLNTTTGEPLFGTSAIFPSTNAQNVSFGWSHVLWVEMAEVVPERATLNFNQPRGFLACFEYRIDDAPPLEGETNQNTLVDGLWPHVCVGGGEPLEKTETFTAREHIDIRLAFGGESNERFDWTRFYVLSLDNKDQCKNGQWQELGFRNQGQCIRFVETGKDSR